jgi:hypothetical protein
MSTALESQISAQVYSSVRQGAGCQGLLVCYAKMLDLLSSPSPARLAQLEAVTAQLALVITRLSALLDSELTSNMDRQVVPLIIGLVAYCLAAGIGYLLLVRRRLVWELRQYKATLALLLYIPSHHVLRSKVLD